jgi:hypothetical protein
MLNRIKKYGYQMQITDFFQFQTIREQGEELAARKASMEPDVFDRSVESPEEHVLKLRSAVDANPIKIFAFPGSME